MVDHLDYAFPHAAPDEATRLELLQQRLDPLTIRRLEHLDAVGPGATCLEIGGGRGSITRWVSDRVGAEGRVVSTDLQPGFLEAMDLPNVQVLQHDIRTDGFPAASFDLVHARAVLMHVTVDPELVSRMVGWLRPGGWLLLEEPDFGMWSLDADPVWAAHPQAWHRSFPNGSPSRGRWLLDQLPTLDLVDKGADAEVDVVLPGTSLARFYELSLQTVGRAAVAAGVLTARQAQAQAQRPLDPDFCSIGFVYVGVWGRQAPAAPPA